MSRALLPARRARENGLSRAPLPARARARVIALSRSLLTPRGRLLSLSLARAPARAKIDRYVRFYLERHSFLERIKPRLAVQRLFQQFYSKCDVVAAPNRAVGQKLVAKIGVPAEKIGYFPRGINTTLYTAEKRSDAFRRLRMNASRDDIIVLWAARVVKEKGALLYADAAHSTMMSSRLAFMRSRRNASERFSAV